MPESEGPLPFSAYVRSFAEYRTRDDGRLSSWIARIVASVPTLGGVFVDLGCGVGRFTGPVAVRAAARYGVDADPGMLARAKARDRDGICWLRAQAESTPFASGSVDVILASMLLEHVADKAALFAEITRILRTGGRLVLRTMLPDDIERTTWYTLFPLAAQCELGRTLPIEEIVRLAGATGLALLSCHSYRDPVDPTEALKLPQRVRAGSYEILRRLDSALVEQACADIERALAQPGFREYKSASMVVLGKSL
jgi:SAM-dependent methyltransferase